MKEKETNLGNSNEFGIDKSIIPHYLVQSIVSVNKKN